MITERNQCILTPKRLTDRDLHQVLACALQGNETVLYDYRKESMHINPKKAD